MPSTNRCPRSKFSDNASKARPETSSGGCAGFIGQHLGDIDSDCIKFVTNEKRSAAVKWFFLCTHQCNALLLCTSQPPSHTFHESAMCSPIDHIGIGREGGTGAIIFMMAGDELNVTLQGKSFSTSKTARRIMVSTGGTIRR